jgi:hypothetical protein
LIVGDYVDASGHHHGFVGILPPPPPPPGTSAEMILRNVNTGAAPWAPWDWIGR